LDLFSRCSGLGEQLSHQQLVSDHESVFPSGAFARWDRLAGLLDFTIASLLLVGMMLYSRKDELATAAQPAGHSPNGPADDRSQHVLGGNECAVPGYQIRAAVRHSDLTVRNPHHLSGEHGSGAAPASIGSESMLGNGG
jgi:hypothetical protein